MKANRQDRRVWRIVMLTVLVLLVSGCASTKIRKDTSATSATKKAKGPAPLYYDCGDVLVPSELKLEKEGSFVFRTPGFSAGVLSLKGRVEINSLIDFFNSNMAKDNWQLVSSFKSRRTIMLFNKENRWCVINITEGDYYTYTEIWVSPTTTATETGLLK